MGFPGYCYSMRSGRTIRISGFDQDILSFLELYLGGEENDTMSELRQGYGGYRTGL
jgi:hypothetical protein